MKVRTIFIIKALLKIIRKLIKQLKNILKGKLLNILMDNPAEYKKAVEIIRKRQEYNKQYYASRKKNQSEPKKKCGRKPIEEITQERAEEILRKYKAKQQNQNKKKLETPEEIKQEINKLFIKLKSITPSK